MKKIAIFASGAGTNAQKIIDHFSAISVNGSTENNVSVALIVSSRPDAGVLNIAKANNIPALVIDKEKFYNGNSYVDELKAAGIGLIVLAGFLLKVPVSLIRAYPKKMINIHPALLPKYGGKGMYGRYVHEAVIASNETESGISVHFVDEIYDHGQVILQVKYLVTGNETPGSLAKNVQQLEHRHFPAAIRLIATL